MKQSPWRHLRIGLLLLAVPILGIAWWINVTQTSSGDHAEMVREFLSPFPAVLSSAQLVTWIQLAFSGAAAYAFFRGLSERGIVMFVNLVMLGLSGLIGFWLLFTLM